MDRLYAAFGGRVAVVDVEGETVDAGREAGRVVGAEHRRTAEPRPGASLQCVAASPLAPDVVCCGTADHGLFRSTDAGRTWHRADGIDHGRVTSVAAAVVDGDTGVSRGDGSHDVERDAGAEDATDERVEWWAGTEPSRIYRSRDGVTWTERDGLIDLPSASSWAFPPRPHTHHVRWIEVDPHDPDHLYVAVEAGALVQTHDGGETWEDRVADSRRDTHTMATHSEAPGRVYCAAGDGYAETTDGGETWHYPQEGLAHRYCWSVVADPADPTHRLVSAAKGAMTAHRVGSADNDVYRRRGDRAWERVEGLPTGASVTRYVLDVGDEGFYALSNAGLFHSDGGESWERLPLDVPDAATAAGLAVV